MISMLIDKLTNRLDKAGYIINKLMIHCLNYNLNNYYLK